MYDPPRLVRSLNGMPRSFSVNVGVAIVPGFSARSLNLNGHKLGCLDLFSVNARGEDNSARVKVISPSYPVDK